MRNVLIIMMVITCGRLLAQQTIFSVMQDATKLGDQAFSKGDYSTAIEHYTTAATKDPNNLQTQSKIAKSYFHLKEYQKCIEAYNKIQANRSLTPGENYDYAECQSSVGNYAVAIAYYKKCLENDRENELISKKIWALSNIHFLREDSSHYRIKAMDVVNTRASELGAVSYGNTIVFTSNRKGARPLDMASTDPAGPFFELYSTEYRSDSISKQKNFSKPSRFAKSLGLSYNAGPVAFYDHFTKMIFVASSRESGVDGSRSLGLHFAEFKDSKWKLTSSWVHNSNEYSITDVTINEEGNRIYFSSNMKGGHGGKDIYTSALKADGNWSKPANVGETINTKGNEVFPYLHRNGTLYFSSDGLPGLGGLDIFQSVVKSKAYSEPENIGYPINSQSDDFGLTFDSLATHGYFSSNRVNHGFDDDIYEFEMDLQTFPFEMAGVLKYKEHSWSDTTDIHSWPNMEITLVDTWDSIEVGKTRTGSDGTFTITIPYFGRFHLLITDENGYDHKASVELEKYRTEAFRHEIVVVKDLFAELKDNEQK